MKIDFHCHLTPRAYLDAIRRQPARYQASLESRDGTEFLTPAGYSFAAGWPIHAGFWDPGARLRRMQEVGLDVEAISSPTYLFYYWADPALAFDVAQMTNDAVAEAMAKQPGRFAGMATVPLQDPQRAADELGRAVQHLGLRAVEIGTQIAGRELDDRALDPFYARVQELDVPVFIHPNSAEGGERTKRFYFGNLLGFPFDTALALSAVIFGGVLDRFPRLALCFAHGGGFLPYQIGRLDHAADVRPECRLLARRPREYMCSMYYDTLTHSHDALRWLVRMVGDDHVLCASDYPYDMGEAEPVRFVEQSGLPPETISQILGANAARLLKLPPAP